MNKGKLWLLSLFEHGNVLKGNLHGVKVRGKFDWSLQLRHNLLLFPQNF